MKKEQRDEAEALLQRRAEPRGHLDKVCGDREPEEFILDAERLETKRERAQLDHRRDVLQCRF